MTRPKASSGDRLGHLDRPSGLATLIGLDVVPAHQLDRTALVLDLLADASVDRPTGAARLPSAVRVVSA